MVTQAEYHNLMIKGHTHEQIIDALISPFFKSMLFPFLLLCTTMVVFYCILFFELSLFFLSQAQRNIRYFHIILQ